VGETLPSQGVLCGGSAGSSAGPLGQERSLQHVDSSTHTHTPVLLVAGSSVAQILGFLAMFALKHSGQHLSHRQEPRTISTPVGSHVTSLGSKRGLFLRSVHLTSVPRWPHCHWGNMVYSWPDSQSACGFSSVTRCHIILSSSMSFLKSNLSC
jgi:hypothetical protein